MHARSEFVAQLRALPDTPVAWTGDRPADEDARLVWEALTRRRLTTYRSVVEWVGDQMFRRDVQRLGTVADVGFFRSFYLAHARQLLGRLDGSVLHILGGAPS
jgi:hypothetical protein